MGKTMSDQNDKKAVAFEDMAQVEVDFLGQRIVIGCIEGEEEKTIRLVNRLEIDAGEVTKAVSVPIEPIQAMLMASLFAYEKLDQLESAAGVERG